MAEMAEHAIGDLKVCQFMRAAHRREARRRACVRVSPPGLEVDARRTSTSTGFLPARALGERVEVKGPTMHDRAAARASRSFTEGHPIAVRLKDVDFVRLQVMLELA